LKKSHKFALRIVKVYKYLTEEKKEYILSKQVLVSGIHIGAHIKVAQEAESKGEFTHEMQMALQHVSRTEYWLQLLTESDFLDTKSFNSIDADREELRRLIISIVKSSKGIRKES
jgi:four helix bundle protein